MTKNKIKLLVTTDFFWLSTSRSLMTSNHKLQSVKTSSWMNYKSQTSSWMTKVFSSLNLTRDLPFQRSTTTTHPQMLPICYNRCEHGSICLWNLTFTRKTSQRYALGIKLWSATVQIWSKYSLTLRCLKLSQTTLQGLNHFSLSWSRA